MHPFAPCTVVMLSAAILCGCGGTPVNTGSVTDFDFVNAPVGASGLPEIAVGQTLTLSVKGQGTCPVLTNFGIDATGASQDFLQFNIGSPQRLFEFSYPVSSWYGKKTVTVQAHGSCIGTVKKLIVVKDADPAHASANRPFVRVDLPIVTPVNVCFTVQTGEALQPFGSPREVYRPLQKNTLVRVNADGRANFLGTQYGPEGDGFVADASFPFPGFSRYAYIYRVGQLKVPAAAEHVDVLFRTTERAQLELCVNTNGATFGIAGLEVVVDESNATP